MECAMAISSVTSEVWLSLIGTLGVGWIGFRDTTSVSSVPFTWAMIHCKLVLECLFF